MADAATQKLAAQKPDAGPQGDVRDFYETKLKTARFYMKKVMPQAAAHLGAMEGGADTLMDIPAEKFAHAQTTIGA